MKTLRSLVLTVILMFLLGGCHIPDLVRMAYRKVSHEFTITNNAGANIESIVIELDDGDLRNGKSHVFASVGSGKLMAGDSVKMEYVFGETKNGYGRYRAIARLKNGDSLTEEFGYFSDWNIKEIYLLTIESKKIVLTRRIFPESK